MKKIINIANDFSIAPGGRYKKNGPNSGERFREDILIPALTNEDITSVTIDLEGLLATPSSFFEEAFGGLIRATKENKILLNIIKSKLKISDNKKLPQLAKEIKTYMLDAEKDL